MAGHIVSRGSLQSGEEDDDDSLSVSSTQVDEEEDANKSYYVDRILAEHMDSDGKMFYLIKWEGYLLAESTWEPEENIEDSKTLDEWDEEKELIAQGLSDPFDLEEFDEEVRQLERERSRQRKRRRAKRRRRGIVVSPSDSDGEQRYGSDSSTEAEEVNDGPEDAPGIKRRRRGSSALTEDGTGNRGGTVKLKRPATKKRIRDETHASGQKKRNDDDNSITSDDSLAGELREKAERAKQRGAEKRAGHSKRISVKDSDIVPKSNTGESSKQHPLQPRPTFSAATIPKDGPTASKNTAKTALELPSRTGYQGTANRGRAVSSTGETRGKGHLRGSSLSRGLGRVLGRGLGRGFGRGNGRREESGSIPNFTTSGPQTISRGKSRSFGNALLEAGANNSNRPLGHFKTPSMARKAELAGRALADRAPDLASVGPLINPSHYPGIRPIPKRPRLEGQRKMPEPDLPHEQKQQTPENNAVQTSPTDAVVESIPSLFLEENDQLSRTLKLPVEVLSLETGAYGDRGKQPLLGSPGTGIASAFNFEDSDSTMLVDTNLEESTLPEGQPGSLSSIPGPPLGQISKESLSSQPVKTTKVRFNDQQINQARDDNGQGVLLRAQFGHNSSETVSITFKDIDKSSQEAWVQTLRGLDTILFDRICITQDFKSQLIFMQKRILAGGSLLTDSSGTAVLEKVALYLRPVLGLLFSFETFNILLFPAKCEDWKFIESTSSPNINAMLRYHIFESDRNLLGLSHDPSAEIIKSSLNLERAYFDSLTELTLGLRYNRLQPAQKGSHKAQSFYLIFPPKSTQFLSFLIEWLKGCDPDCRVFLSQKEGSWNTFISADTRIIIIHESLVPQVFRFPNFSGLFSGKGSSSIWCFGGSLSPQLRSMAANGNTIEDGPALLRLFPHGGAVFLTPSFLIEEPQRTHDLLKWFQSRASYGTWRLVTCHDFCRYLFDLAIQKASQRENLLSSLPVGTENKEAIAAGRGLSYRECDYRFCNFGIVEKLKGNEDTSEQNDCSIIYADESIHQDDEKSLVAWFAGWTMLNLSLFRKFVVIGTSSRRSIEEPIVNAHQRGSSSLSPKTQIESSTVTLPDALGSPVSSTVPRISRTLDISHLEPSQAANFSTGEKDTSGCHNTSSKFGRSNPAADDLNVSRIVSSTPRPDGAQAFGGLHEREEVNVDTSKGKSARSGHGIDKSANISILKFIAFTGEDRNTAEDYLARNNNDVQRATREYFLSKPGSRDISGIVDRDGPLDASRMLDFSAVSTMASEEPRLNPFTMNDDVRRAIEIYKSSLPADESEDSIIVQPLPKTGVEIDENDWRFGSAHPQPSTRPEHVSAVKAPQTGPDNKQGSNRPLRKISETQLPVGFSKETVPDTASRNPGIKPESTVEWYCKSRAAGQGWEHIYVDGWEECFKLLSIKGK